MTLPARAAALVAQLELTPHPEGGFFREIFRAPSTVTTAFGTSRAALTVIHFLLPRGAHSALHRVTADEAWHFLEGDPLELTWLAADGARHVVRLGAHVDGAVPVAVVPACAWQACRPLGEYALVACDVAPGFEFADFTLLRNDPAALEALLAAHPDLGELA